MSSSARTLKHVSLELGAKSPVIVFPDADLDRAIKAVVLGFTGNSGQACTAPTRIVHDAIYDEFSARLVAAVQALVVGDPWDEATQLGPLTSSEQFERVIDYIAAGIAEGARISAGGGRHGSCGFFVEPTVFTDVRADMKIACEEIFGPVGALMRFSDEADAVARANDTSFGLAASIWTRDAARAHHIAGAVQAGIVWINTVFELDPLAPFGGYKMSGFGRELGAESIDDFTQIKTVVMRY